MNNEPSPALPTGLEDLDAVLEGGLRPGELAVVTGPTGIGKSCLALNLLRHAAITLGRPAVLFTWEMSSTEVGMRILSAEAAVLLTRMRTGTVGEEGWARIHGHSPRIAAAPLHIADSTEPAASAVRAAVGGLERHPELIVVDYVQMLSGIAVNDPADVGKNTRRLKLLAREHNTVVVAVCQLDDDSETVGALNMRARQDADVVVFLSRDDFRDRDSPRLGEADILVYKRRGGPTGIATVAHQLHYARFVTMPGQARPPR